MEQLTAAPYREVDIAGPDGEVRVEYLRCRTKFYVGVDLGKYHSHTAVAVIERAEVIYRRGPRDARTMEFPTETRYFLRYLERMPLDVPYLQIAERLRQMVRRPPLAGRVQTVVDATGVGIPVVEQLQSGPGLGCPLVPVVITSGEYGSAGSGPGNSGFRVPKRDLLEGLVVAFEGDAPQLEIAGDLGVELEMLIRELRSMRVRGSGAARGAVTDDLVLAVALAWWKARREKGWVG